MKTKIIYISGNELFKMSDIRAAFEEVRNTLNLGRDTVLFGVPIDNDDAMLSSDDNTINANNPDNAEVPEIIQTEKIPTNEFISDTEEIVSTTPDETSDIIDTVATEEIITADVVEPAPKKTRGRRKAVNSAKINTNATSGIYEQEQSVSNTNDVAQEPGTEKIIPILSVLAVNKEADIAADDSGNNKQEQIINQDIADDDTPIIDDIDVSTELATPSDDTNSDAQMATTTIADMINDDAPSAPVEKTLEQLLESMAPLREDAIDDAPIAEMNAEQIDIVETSDETDATLEQLAAEFAENQDKIPTESKPESHSKIGKLKNILPFKKVKREENGIMGDLFGWAGIAANDDDFSIPGFFTNAASKK